MKYYQAKRTINMDIFNLVNFGELVMDVGCFDGLLGEALLKEKGCIVDGIDNCSNALQEAKLKGYHNTYEVDLNNINSLLIEKKYDKIIMADVLEHIIEPKILLNWARGHLREDGKILICIPNVAFFLYRLLLLFGKFEYTEGIGTMDNTHLRFFTKKSFETLVSKCDYNILSSFAADTLSKKYFFIKWASRVIPTLFAYQIIFVIQNNKEQALK